MVGYTDDGGNGVFVLVRFLSSRFVVEFLYQVSYIVAMRNNIL